jgi:hypothetical protein
MFVANIYGSFTKTGINFLHTNILVWTNQGRIYREANEGPSLVPGPSKALEGALSIYSLSFLILYS